MRKTNLFVSVAMTALAASSMCVSATEDNGKKDEYLIIDLEKILEKSEEESSAAVDEAEEASSDAQEDLATFYLNLFDQEDTGDYNVNGTFAKEPILAKFLAQNEGFDGYDAAGFYEITGDTRRDLDQYELNLVLADDANLYHYSLENGTLMKTPLKAVFGEEQEVYQTVHHEAETTVVHHEATGHNEKVIDQAAWDETVTTGYMCSGCGAVQ